MKRIILLLTIMFSLMSCQVSTNKSGTKSGETLKFNEEEAEMVQGVNEYSFRLFNAVLDADQSDNILISPLSASLALSMTAMGAEEETLSQMMSALGFDGVEKGEVAKFYSLISSKLSNADPKTVVNVANSIWANKELTIKKDFIKDAEEFFHSDVYSLDFAKEESVDKINSWCAEKTNDKIEKVLDQLEPSLQMVLINALYFKGVWKEEFDEKMTNKATFNKADGTTQEVDMMFQKDSFKYAETDNFKVAELPYGNGTYSMVAILPNEGVELRSVLKDIDANGWNELNNSMEEQKINLYVPRFKLSYSVKLNDILKSLGMVDAFDGEKADFSSISDGLFIDFVKQDTFIEVNEKGTEAAAVTTVGLMKMSIDYTPTFRLDRPFALFIKENSSGIILFNGLIGEIE